MFMLKARSRVVDVPGVVWALTRSLFIVAVMVALLVSAGVAYAQGTPTVPTIESVAVTSNPGEDGGYAIGDEIQVGLTFSEAVAVTGAPQINLDVGGLSRTAEYSEGTTTTQLLFTYTVLSGDEDTDGIAVVANSLALNGGAIRAGATNATLTHAALQANDHKVDGIAPSVTVGGETRTYVSPDRQFNVVFYFSEKVYGITDAEITVTNGAAHDVHAITSFNAMWPRYTRWDVIIVSAAEGPVTVTLEAGAATDAYGNENTAPGSALSVIAADPVMVEVTRTTSGFAEGGKAAFIVTRSRDNGAIPVSLSLDQTGDFLSGAVEVYPPPDPNMPENPVTPTEVEFTETPFTLNLTFAAGETSKRIALPTEDDYKDEDDGTVTLSVPAKADQYKYIPGNTASVTADVRDNDVAPEVSLHWVLPDHPYNAATSLNTALEGGSIDLLALGAARGQPLVVTLSVTEVGSYLDLDGEGAEGYQDLGNGKLQVTIPTGQLLKNLSIPLLDNAAMEADGSVTITVQEDPDRNYTPAASLNTRTITVKDNDSPSTVSISGGSDVTEGAQLSYTLTRAWAPGQDQGQLIVNVQLAETGDYITWHTDYQPDANDMVTIPVTIAKGSLTGALTLDTADDAVSENAGSVTATILADTNGKYVAGTSSAVTTTLLDNDPPIISVEAVAAVVTEGANAQYRITRSGNTSGSLRVGLYVTGLPKIMTDATETIVLTSDNEDQSKRLTFNGAWVDYILEFAAGETEKTLPLTTEADSINEGDGWLGVTIVQRVANPFSIGTGYAQVLVKDDDIPTVSLIRPVGPTGLTLSSDGTTWEGKIVEGTQFTYNSTCTGVTAFSDDARVNLDPVSMWVQYSNHPAFYGEQYQNNTLGYNKAGIHHLGADCSSQTVTYRDYRFYVGPENGVLEIEIMPRSELVKQGGGSSRYRPRLFAELALQYEAAAAEARAAGTLITQKNIFHPINLTGYHPEFACNESDLRYCPQYQVGTVNKIRLTVTNRDPTVLIRAESTSVTEGQPARFILERRWATDLLELPPPQSETVVYLRAYQDEQYITGALPTQITFGQNETRKVVELQTVDDSAFGDNGSVTIELLPDTSTGSVNLHGNYTIWENWVGHTPTGGRSDKATVTITNNDDKPGITIAPASATEGDSGSANMTFTLTLGQAVSQDVTVNYVTSDGTATAGQDYTAVTGGTATIPANSTSSTFTVSVTGDTTDEPNETFNVTISLPEPEPDLPDESDSSTPGVAIVGGNTATVSGTIVDDDPVVVTVAHKADSVVEGQDAVFVLTRTGYTDDALSMQVRLSAPGKVETLSAEFEAGATTTELSVETEDNDLVDYPSARDYTIEALGDGDINGGDDEIYTPGDPSQATVSVTDNDELQIITVHPHEAFVREGGEVKYVFRRTGDTSEELRFTYVRTARQAESTGYLDYNFVNELFPAGVSEITTGALVNGGVFPNDQVVNRLFPYKFTAQVYGDGHRYGVHRIWKAGAPNTATIVLYDDDRTRNTVLRAKYTGLGQVGQTINIDFEVLNTGSEATGNSITVSSVQRAVGDRNQTKPAEPRAGCSISGSLATGEMGTCRATFTLTAQDLTDSPMVLDATASDGTTTSSTLRIYITVLGGVAVGFNETTRLSVTEPANGAANAKAVLAVTRIGESDEQVQVAYTVEPIHTQNRPYPAEEGADYVDNSATPGILTFAANETEKNITIDILGDEIDEQREQFRVTLVPPEGVLVEAAKRSRVVAIVNRDPPSGESYLPTASLELVSADPTPESAGSVDFAVVLDRVWGEDARFEVELDAHDNLTATPAFSRLGQTGDFEDPDGLIHATIPAGQTRFEFSLTLYDDDVREEDETFQMLLGSSITKYLRLIGDEDEALVTIADDDFIEPTGVELALTRNNGVFDSVAENSSRREITVTASFSDIHWPTDAADAALRQADPRDVDTTVRVEFDSANSTAAQIDLERFRVADSQGTFRDVESFDIVIPAGQTSGTTTLRFKPENDDVDEEGETVILQGAEVVASDSDELLPVNSASFTITDDDTRGITLSPASLATGSGIGMMEGGTSTYSLVLDSEPTDTVTVTVSSEQDNLIRLTPETLTFTPSNWSATQTISVESMDDGADTSFRDAFIAHRVSGGDYGSVSVDNIWVIIENTTQAYIYLDDAQASESDGYVEFTVSVRPILRTVPVVVRYTTVDGTAAAGTDYTRQVNTGQTYKIFSIPANGGAATIRIPITDNEVYGPAKKTFTLQLTNQNNKALLDGDATSLTATGSIIDDDPKPVVSVAGPAGDLSYVSEDMKGPVTFTLTLTGRSAADVTVDYATGQTQVLRGLAARQGITPATAGEDYTAATGTVTFSPGDATKQVTVQLTNDDVSEDTEFFGFKISNAQNAHLRNDATEEVADVGLLDDDPRGVAIDPTSISLEEPAPGEAAVASSYTVKLNSKPTDTVTVTIGGANPAVSLSGATLSNTNTLTFTTSNWDTAQSVTVTPVEDANGIGETITLTHIQSGGDYTGIAADSVTINVTDSDTRNVVLSPTSLTVTEGDDTGVSYTVKLSTRPSDTITVTIGGHSGTDLSISGATLSNSNTLTFSMSNWNTAQMVTVKAGHDGNADDESETLTHTASGGDYANLTKDLPVTVTDDAPATVTVQFGQAAYTVAESDDPDTTDVAENTVEVTVTLSADPERTVIIPIEKTNQGGATTADYSGVPQNVTFDSGDTSKSFTFTAAHDTVDDDGESVQLSFGATLPDGVSAGTPATSAVSITDDDVPSVTVSFGSAAYTVAESDDTGTTDVTENTVEVTVTLSADPERTVVIPIEKINQGGATTADYSGVPQNVTFDSGDTSKSFTFTAETDTVDDDGESVKLSFGATLPDGVSAGTPATSAVTITDDDVPSVTVSFGAASYTVAESDDSDTPDLTENTVEVTVTLSADPERTVIIPIEKINQGGATTADYSGVPQNVTFDSGDTSKSFTFTAETDTDDDDGESVKLSFGATLPDGVSAGTPATSAVTITDDDVPSVTVSFGSAAYTVAESDDSDTTGVTENTVEVTVTLSADPERTVVIPIEKINQGGATTADYSGVPQNVTFDSGDTSKSFTFTAETDTVDDDGESVQLSFGATLPTGVSAGTPATSAVTITDDDVPSVTVSFGAASYTVAEGSSRTVTVTLDADPERTLTIPIEAANEGGASDSDYTGVPVNVTFEAGDTSQTFDISATEDNLAEAGEKVKLSFGTLPAETTAGDPAVATVSLLDRTQGQDLPTPPTVHFENAAYSVNEGASVAVKVKLSKAPGSEAVIPISRANRAGATDPDHSGVPDTLTFGATDTEKTITFAATDDTVDDDGEKVELSFGTLPGGFTATSGEASEAVVTITDDDDATAKAIVLSPASITVEEENATGTTYTVKLASQPSGDVTVIVYGLSGTDLIISGTTLNANDELTLTFTASDWSAAQTVTVKAAHDADPFGDTAFLLHRATGGGYDSASKTLPVTVTDDDTAAVVLSPASITVNEGDTTGVTYTVKLSHAPAGAVTVTIGGHSGTDLSVSGTALTGNQLSFTALNWSAAQTVTVKADNDDNAVSESLTLTHTPSGGGYSTAADLPVTVTDDDSAAIVLSESALTLTEGDDTGVSYTVKLSTRPSDTITVTIGGHSGTDLSVSGTTLTGNQLSFTALNWSAAQTVTVKAGEDDNAADESETLTHTASGADYAGVTKNLPVTVEDDAPDTVTVSFGSAAYTVAESDDSDTTNVTENTVEVTVTLSADPERTVIIPIEKTNQGGATTADYSGVPQNVTFDSGDTSKSFTFTAETDTVDDDGESVQLSFGATLPDGVSAGTPATSAVTITDDDVPSVTVSFGSAAYTVAESDDPDTTDLRENTVEVTVTLSADPERTVIIPIEKTNQGGATTADYSGVPQNVTFDSGDTSKSFTFTAETDTVDDDGESVQLSFGATLPDSVSAGTPATSAVTITDDDVPSVTVSFGSAAYTVAESDDPDTTNVTENTVEVTLTLSADPERTVTIPIEKINQGGATTADYSGVPQNVTFDSGDTSKSFTFTAETDTVDDDGESVQLSFGATLPTGVSAGTPATSAVTITDDDVPSVTVSFGSAAYTVAESDDPDTTDVTENTVEVTVTLSADPERTVVIPIEAANEGGTSDSDYTGVPQNVTFDSGDTSKSFTFTATHDTVDDDNESVQLSFGATLPDGVSAGTPATSAVSITDDDVPSVTVSFGSAAYTVAESDDPDTPDLTENTVEVTVTLSADPERTVIIPIEKTNQGGTSDSDYTGVPESVTFDAGETRKTFVFTAETDTDDDHGESVRLSFNTMPDARVSEGSPSEAMVTIRQDSTPSTSDCNSAIWCADLEFRSESPPGEMWFLGSNFLDSQFHYGGVTYRFGHSSLAPYGHNIPISVQPSPPFAIPERTKLYFSLHNMNASGYDLDRFRVPNDDWMDWTLHISTTKNGETLIAVLPLSEARFGGGESEWRWYGSDLEALRAAWAEGQVYKLKIVEDPRSQRTPKVLGSPLYLKVTPFNNYELHAKWKMPENRVDRAPPNTTYKVQWKEAGDSWDNPADVSEETDSPSPATKETLSHVIRGLTGGVEYHVRVIATNTVGDSEPSEVVSGTPTPLPAAGQNIAANSPAKGAPSIEGTPEVGQTLSAVTTDITDDNGLQDVVFSYQWLADDVEISGADGATYILTSDDLGKAINVRMDFTDNAGNEESLISAPTAAVTAAEDLGLQSATVDGSTLTLTYNETLDTGVTLPASAFVVNVNEASRSIMGAGVGGSSVLLLLSPAVVAGDTVDVDYTKPSGSDVIKDTQGREADSFTGQAVTNNTVSAGTGKSQAPGSPTILKVARHESGQLKASWNAPDSGATPTGYTVQRKESEDDWDDADDVSEANVKGVSHVITGLTDGVQYTVRVIAYKGDAESDPSVEITATPQETVPPSPSSASVDGATLTITFDEALAEVQAPASTAFAVTVAGNSRGVSAVAVSGSAVTLTLVTAVSEGDAVTVDYTAPTGESAARLQDLVGNAAASFSGLDAGNDTQAGDQLTASAHDVPGSHDGSSVFTFELRFSENFYLSYKTLRDHAFTVTGAEVTGARRLAPPSHIGWEIQVEPDGDGAATIVLPVTTDCTAEGAICTEEGRMLSGGLLLVVPGPNTPATGAPTISGTAQVGDTLSAVTTGVEDADGLDNVIYSYQWIRNDGGTDTDISGATGSSYTLAVDDESKVISVKVSFSDDAGNEEESTSAATADVEAKPNTSATGAPAISGTAQVGETLTADTSGIEDADGLTNASFAYQWQADDVDIAGATGSTYTLADADEGKAVSMKVSFADDAGNAETLTSAATDAVEAKPNSPATGAPTISGTAQVGETLTAETSGIADEDGLDNATFSYQWLVDGADIAGATDSTYTLAGSDEGKAISAKVSFTDDAGDAESLTSAATAAAEADPLPPLTASLENIATSHDGENAFTFELRFSKEFSLSYKTLRDHAFTVTGGTVRKAQRLEQGSNVGWRITVRPNSDGAVTIILPITEDCEAQGAICTDDGRKLSTELVLTVSGP